ncbi:MAG TPA: exodeoxyribonuclease I [Candidatus Saccharimonadales bacterium]
MPSLSQPTFFFYDLETSGIDPRKQRIMQFAGQRTDMNLEPVGEPVNIMVALSDEVLPEPYAILVTGITPQKSRDEGYTEAEFLRIFSEQVCQPQTTTLGFNTVRFDDEFMRFTLWRNFYDAYEWQWKDGCSRWDLLDVVRMTRALRPEGISWPVDSSGAPTNRLELLTKQNGLLHTHAHDALSDVLATISVAKLIKQQQPKLFDYLLTMRGKKAVEGLVNLADPQPFVYTSGRYPKEIAHTTVAYPIAPGSRPGSVVVWDLRHDPAEWARKSPEELKKVRFAAAEVRKAEGFVPLPAKELVYNRCPAVAPLGVLDAAAQARLGLSLEAVQQNLNKLANSGLAETLDQVFAVREMPSSSDVDVALYDGFIGDTDKTHMSVVRAAEPDDLKAMKLQFNDRRLSELLVRYKGRNVPQALNEDERAAWEAYRAKRIAADLPAFGKQLAQAGAQAKSEEQRFLLQELQLWAESIVPIGEEASA